jgi:hypothetical protein
MKTKIHYSERALLATAELLVALHANSPEGIFGKSTVEEYVRLLRKYMFELLADSSCTAIGTCGFYITKSDDFDVTLIDFYVDPMAGAYFYG